jgi:hypothetical protein
MAKRKGEERRWQYGLRSFLVVTMVLGAGIGWWLREQALFAEENAALVKLHPFYPEVKFRWGHVTELVLYKDPAQPTDDDRRRNGA